MKKYLRYTLISEFIVAALLYFRGNGCGSACGDPHSLLNPFGYQGTNQLQIICTPNCVFVPHSLFWIFADLFILTLTAYLVLNFFEELNKPVDSTKNKNGITALVGGLIVIIFGGAGLFALLIIPVTIAASIFSFVKERGSKSSLIMSIVGIILLVVAVILATIYHWNGFWFEFIRYLYTSS